MNELVEVLMRREDMTREEVIEWITETYEEGEDPEEFLYNELGLEPDYVFDLMDLVM
jgi:hypothetical protein